MSSGIGSEPITKGKVVLKTTLGDIDIELWSKETPKTCRNFIQLCLENFYNNTIFHRIIKDYIVQGGDPTATGEGGESIYNAPFADEFHSRLRFTHRGIVAMASSGPNKNLSQFFITLVRADILDKKHTIFGKVVGDTIFNVLKVNDYELIDERPVNPPKILSVDVIFNPFEDIIPRVRKIESVIPVQIELKKPKGVKNKSLLSFFNEEEDAETDETEVAKIKIKSSYHFSNDPEIKAILAEEAARAEEKRKNNSTKQLINPNELDLQLKEKIIQKQVEIKAKKNEQNEHTKQDILSNSANKRPIEDEKEPEEEEGEMNLNSKEKKFDGAQLLQERKIKYNSRKLARNDPKRQAQVLEKVALFQCKLLEQKNLQPTLNTQPKQKLEVESINNQQSISIIDEPNDNNPEWLTHKLEFQKITEAVDLMARNEDDHYEIYDPLLAATKDGIQLTKPQKPIRRLSRKN
eukprot:TRINITY_DN3516_c0_g2_i1.p1 TRINITY_DN3516_c0_g2~~TRINITY_DN3516_c0_g2_i1.p1  ORF type:complete len:464 (-),score=196.36 TRINITY_DN3516_c0_g2_i1:70-1461(-)